MYTSLDISREFFTLKRRLKNKQKKPNNEIYLSFTSIDQEDKKRSTEHALKHMENCLADFHLNRNPVFEADNICVASGRSKSNEHILKECYEIARSQEAQLEHHPRHLDGSSLIVLTKTKKKRPKWLKFIFKTPVTSLLTGLLLALSYLYWDRRIAPKKLVGDLDLMIPKLNNTDTLLPSYEIWRILTGPTAHFDVWHMLLNTSSLISLGQEFENKERSSLEYLYTSLSLLVWTNAGWLLLLLYRRRFYVEDPQRCSNGFSGVLFVWSMSSALGRQRSCPLFFAPNVCFESIHSPLGLTFNVASLVKLAVFQAAIPGVSWTMHLVGCILGLLLHWRMIPSLLLEPQLVWPLMYAFYLRYIRRAQICISLSALLKLSMRNCLITSCIVSWLLSLAAYGPLSPLALSQAAFLFFVVQFYFNLFADQDRPVKWAAVWGRGLVLVAVLMIVTDAFTMGSWLFVTNFVTANNDNLLLTLMARLVNFLVALVACVVEMQFDNETGIFRAVFNDSVLDPCRELGLWLSPSWGRSRKPPRQGFLNGWANHTKAAGIALGGTQPGTVIPTELIEPGLLGIKAEQRHNSLGTTIVATVLEDSQASRAGVKPGDILCVSGTYGKEEIVFEEFLEMARSEDRPLRFDVRRFKRKLNGIVSSERMGEESADVASRKQLVAEAARDRQDTFRSERTMKPANGLPRDGPSIRLTPLQAKLQSDRKAALDANNLQPQSEASRIAVDKVKAVETLSKVKDAAFSSAPSKGLIHKPGLPTNSDFDRLYEVVVSTNAHDDVVRCFATIQRLLVNATTKGQDANEETAARFRRVRLEGNTRIKVSVLQVEGAVELLLCCGFQMGTDEKTKGSLLLYPPFDNGPSWLSTALYRMESYGKPSAVIGPDFHGALVTLVTSNSDAQVAQTLSVLRGLLEFSVSCSEGEDILRISVDANSELKQILSVEGGYDLFVACGFQLLQVDDSDETVLVHALDTSEWLPAAFDEIRLYEKAVM